jgi:hypothetical protein
MPASSGRTRMPHNNRMSIDASLKTSSIWSKTIGHDPHASHNEQGDNDDDAIIKQAQDKTTRDTVLALAKQQNLTDGANRDDFALKMYQGLKQSKKQRKEINASHEFEISASQKQRLQDDPLSSSEDEYVAVAAAVKKSKQDKHRKKRKHKSRRSSSEESQSDSETSENNKRRPSKRKRKHKKRRRSYDSDDESSDDSYERRRKRKSKDRQRRRNKKHSRKTSSSDDDDSSSDSSSSSVSESRRYSKDKDRKSSSRRKNDKEPETLTSFVLSNSFQGSRKGYAFKMGDSGLGYYLDKPRKVNRKELDEILRWHQDA